MFYGRDNSIKGIGPGCCRLRSSNSCETISKINTDDVQYQSALVRTSIVLYFCKRLDSFAYKRIR
jgi:hypothetical protein